MNNNEIKLYINQFKKFTDQLIKSEDQLKQFLIRANIHDSKNKLKNKYKI